MFAWHCGGHGCCSFFLDLFWCKLLCVWLVGASEKGGVVWALPPEDVSIFKLFSVAFPSQPSKTPTRPQSQTLQNGETPRQGGPKRAKNGPKAERSRGRTWDVCDGRDDGQRAPKHLHNMAPEQQARCPKRRQISTVTCVLGASDLSIATRGPAR